MPKNRGNEHRSGRRRREQRPANPASDRTVIASGAESRDAAGSKATHELPDLGALARLGPHPDVGADPALVVGIGLPDVASLLAQELDRLELADLTSGGTGTPAHPVSPAMGGGDPGLPDLAALSDAPEPGLPDLSGLTAAGLDLPDLRKLPEPEAAPQTDPLLPDLSGLASLPFGEADAMPAWRFADALPAPALELDQLGRAAVAAVSGDECVVFSVAGARFAVPLHNVAQVGELGHVTRVPNTPDWIVGVIGWREDVISLIDVPRLLGQPSEVPGGHVVVIRTDDGDMAAGLLVERLGRIERYPRDQFDGRPLDGSLGQIARGAYRAEATPEVVAVDVERLLTAAWPEALGAGA
jgi:chemotaxis signal transduction protein